MNFQCRPLLICTFCLLLGCGQKGHEAVEQPPATDRSGVESSPKPTLEESKITKIQMQRSGCFGSCPVYAVDIDRNGVISFDGTKYIEIPGHHGGSATPAEVDTLISDIKHINFFKLRDSYESDSDGCTSWATDNPSVSISVTRGAEIKRVVYDYGCRGFDAEDGIKSLAKSIDRVAQTKKWIGARVNML